MAREKIETVSYPTFPIVWFADGYFGQVKRIIENGNKMTMVLVPDGHLTKSHPDLKEEFDKTGKIQLEFLKEYVLIENPDPISPRLRVLTNVKGQIVENPDKKFLTIIESQRKDIDELKLRLLQKEHENKVLLEDFEAGVDRWERIRSKVKQPTIVMNQPEGSPMAEEDS